MGDNDNATIRQRIFDYYVDYNKGAVGFAPALSGPSQDAPAYVRAVTLEPPSPVGMQTVQFDVQFSRADGSGAPADPGCYAAGEVADTHAHGRRRVRGSPPMERVYVVGTPTFGV